MASEIDICNIALGRIGINDSISSLGTANERERVCTRLYPEVRDQVLEDFPWGFAQTVVALAMLSDTTTLGYTYRYGLPDDCARAQVLTDVAGMRWDGGGPGVGIWDYAIRFGSMSGRIQFQIMANRDNLPAQMILTDIPEAYLWYTMRVVDPNQMTAMFRSALSWKLAAELALPLRAEKGMAETAGSAYMAEVSRAQVQTLSQRQDASYMPQSDSINARFS